MPAADEWASFAVQSCGSNGGRARLLTVPTEAGATPKNEETAAGGGTFARICPPICGRALSPGWANGRRRLLGAARSDVVLTGPSSSNDRAGRVRDCDGRRVCVSDVRVGRRGGGTARCDGAGRSAAGVAGRTMGRHRHTHRRKRQRDRKRRSKWGRRAACDPKPCHGLGRTDGQGSDAARVFGVHEALDRTS